MAASVEGDRQPGGSGGRDRMREINCPASGRAVAFTQLLLLPWAAAAVVAFGWSVIRYYPYDGILPIAAAVLTGVVVLSAPMPKQVRLILGLIVGVAIRLLAFHSLTGPSMEADTSYNVQLAANLLSGKGLTVDLPGYGPAIKGMYPPVYILALAAVQALGGTELWLNLAADLVSCAALYRLSGRNDRIAIAYLLFPSIVLASIVPLKEGLAIALLLVAMCVVRRPFLFGIMSALVALTQPAWSPVPLVGFLLLKRTRGEIGWAATGAVMATLPWWVRNAIVFGQFVPLTTSPGFSLWVAVFGSYKAAGTVNVPANEVALSAESGRIALAAIAHDPEAYLKRVARAAVAALALDNEISPMVGLGRAAWVRTSTYLCNGAWAALVAWAALKPRNVDRRWMAFAAGWLVAICLGVWLEFGQRHRVFALPLLLLWISAQSALAGQTAVTRESRKQSALHG